MFFSYRMDDAVSVVQLYHTLHPECQSANETNVQQAKGIELIKVVYFNKFLNIDFFLLWLIQFDCRIGAFKWQSAYHIVDISNRQACLRLIFHSWALDSKDNVLVNFVPMFVQSICKNANLRSIL